ncbi:beige/beach-related [Anaeramoeba ignava]|uniref:Beige/beach-related n=1 Tax=Anaeramoeba ignava TaxID=1746090 RepID=A0A9Q0RCF6_ANAIG|nr:beige/beach-related [Anaeramoeba ignava]
MILKLFSNAIQQNRKPLQKIFFEIELLTNLVTLLVMKESRGKLFLDILTLFSDLIYQNPENIEKFKKVIGFDAFVDVIGVFPENVNPRTVYQILIKMVMRKDFAIRDKYIIENPDFLKLIFSIISKSPEHEVIFLEIIETFQKICKQSIQNILRCCYGGIITFVLELAPKITNLKILEKILSFISLLGSIWITSYELKTEMKLLTKHLQKFNQKLAFIYSKSLTSLLSRKSNQNLDFFDFYSKDSYIQLPEIKKELNLEFTFCTWFKFEKFSSYSHINQNYKPRIFGFASSQSEGFQLYIHFRQDENDLNQIEMKQQPNYTITFTFKIHSKSKPVIKNTFIIPQNMISENGWNFIALTQKSASQNSERVNLFVNDQFNETIKLKCPEMPKKIFIHNFVGAQNPFLAKNPEMFDEKKRTFYGSIGPVFVFKKSLSEKELSSIYALYPYCFLDETQTNHIGPSAKTLFKNVMLSLVFALHPKDIQGQLLAKQNDFVQLENGAKSNDVFPCCLSPAARHLVAVGGSHPFISFFIELSYHIKKTNKQQEFSLNNTNKIIQDRFLKIANDIDIGIGVDFNENENNNNNNSNNNNNNDNKMNIKIFGELCQLFVAIFMQKEFRKDMKKKHGFSFLNNIFRNTSFKEFENEIFALVKNLLLLTTEKKTLRILKNEFLLDLNIFSHFSFNFHKSFIQILSDYISINLTNEKSETSGISSSQGPSISGETSEVDLEPNTPRKERKISQKNFKKQIKEIIDENEFIKKKQKSFLSIVFFDLVNIFYFYDILLNTINSQKNTQDSNKNEPDKIQLTTKQVHEIGNQIVKLIENVIVTERNESAKIQHLKSFISSLDLVKTIYFSEITTKCFSNLISQNIIFRDILSKIPKIREVILYLVHQSNSINTINSLLQVILILESHYPLQSTESVIKEESNKFTMNYSLVIYSILSNKIFDTETSNFLYKIFQNTFCKNPKDTQNIYYLKSLCEMCETQNNEILYEIFSSFLILLSDDQNELNIEKTNMIKEKLLNDKKWHIWFFRLIHPEFMLKFSVMKKNEDRNENKNLVMESFVNIRLKIMEIVFHIFCCVHFYSFVQNTKITFQNELERMLFFIRFLFKKQPDQLFILFNLISNLLEKLISWVEKSSVDLNVNYSFSKNLAYLVNLIYCFVFQQNFSFDPQKDKNEAKETKSTKKKNILRKTATQKQLKSKKSKLLKFSSFSAKKIKPDTKRQFKDHRFMTEYDNIRDKYKEEDSEYDILEILELDMVLKLFELLDRLGIYSNLTNIQSKTITYSFYETILILLLTYMKKVKLEQMQTICDYVVSLYSKVFVKNSILSSNISEFNYITFCYLYKYYRRLEKIKFLQKNKIPIHKNQAFPKSKKMNAETYMDSVNQIKFEDSDNDDDDDNIFGKFEEIDATLIENYKINLNNLKESIKDNLSTKIDILSKCIWDITALEYDFLFRVLNFRGKDKIFPKNREKSKIFKMQLQEFREMLSESRFENAMKKTFWQYKEQVEIKNFQDTKIFLEAQVMIFGVMTNELSQNSEMEEKETEQQINEINKQFQEPIFKEERQRLFSVDFEQKQKVISSFQDFKPFIAKSLYEQYQPLTRLKRYHYSHTKYHKEFGEEHPSFFFRLSSKEDSMRRRFILDIQWSEDIKQNLFKYPISENQRFVFLDKIIRKRRINTDEEKKRIFNLAKTQSDDDLIVHCFWIFLENEIQGFLSIQQKYLLLFQITPTKSGDQTTNRSRDGDNDEDEISFPSTVSNDSLILLNLWEISDISKIYRRTFLHQNNSLEVFFAKSHPCFLRFGSTKSREKVVNFLLNHKQLKLSENISEKIKIKELSSFRKWRHRDISNFEYLMELNTLAGRSYNDLSQYPVFPWILTDYKSEAIDLSDEKIYRDLSKPIGALNPDLSQKYQRTFQTIKKKKKMKPFFYGKHYSNPMIVLSFLFRMEPFTSLFFKKTRRISQSIAVNSISDAWESCLTNQNDVRELIPEFFYFPEFLENINIITSSYPDKKGPKIPDAQLPRWAKNPKDFIRIHRQALESEYVSAHLHEWIDLIFGYKQRGAEAQKAMNVFYPLIYGNSADFSKLDKQQIQITEMQIKALGQIPKKLFKKPHPKRLQLSQIGNPFLSIQLKYQPITLRGHKGKIEDYPILFLKGVEYHENVFFLAKFCKIFTFSSERRIRVHDLYYTNLATQLKYEKSVLKTEFSISSQFILDRTFGIDLKKYPQCFQVDDLGKFAFCCGLSDSSFVVINLENSRISQSISANKGIVTCIAYMKNYLVTGSQEGSVSVWECKDIQHFNETPLHSFFEHEDEVTSVGLDVNLDIVISGSNSGNIIAHTLFKGKHLFTFHEKESSQISLLKITRNGDIVFLSQNGIKISLLNINGRLIRQLSSLDSVYSFSVMHNSQFMFLGGKGFIDIREVETLRLISKINTDQEILSLSFLFDQRYLIAGSGNGDFFLAEILFSAN